MKIVRYPEVGDAVFSSNYSYLGVIVYVTSDQICVNWETTKEYQLAISPRKHLYWDSGWNGTGIWNVSPPKVDY